MNQEILDLASDISDYIETHPNAADNLEGISKWWLAGGENLCKAKVLQALVFLCDIGVVRSVTGRTGSVIYSRLANTPRSKLN